MSDNTGDLSPLRLSRREKILNVAERLFSQQGFRATTMEGVALGVGMSKVTVYGYFRHKDELFQAVASRVADRIKGVVRTELDAGAALPDRLTAALIAKNDLVFKLVRQSAFAGELFAAKDQFAAAIFTDADAEIETMLVDTIAGSGIAPARSASTGRLLFAASTGIANHAANRTEMADHITKLVRSIMADGM